jgi:hypothetical protein
MHFLRIPLFKLRGNVKNGDVIFIFYQVQPCIELGIYLATVDLILEYLHTHSHFYFKHVENNVSFIVSHGQPYIAIIIIILRFV